MADEGVRPRQASAPHKPMSCAGSMNSAQYLHAAQRVMASKLKRPCAAAEHRISCTELLDGFNIPVDWVPQAQ